MKIIKDELRQLNLHPLVIYCVVSPEDPQERVEALKGLNRYQGFTRGIFKFQTVEHMGKYSDNVASELTDILKRYNMVVRLVDDATDSFYYAAHKVNFNKSFDEVEYSIQKFVVEVCRRNIKHLKSRSEVYPQQFFKSAVELKGFRHGVWAKLMGKEVTLDIRPAHNTRIQSSNSPMPDVFREKFSEASAMDKPELLWAWVEQSGLFPAIEESDKTAKSYVKNPPKISVEIKQVVKQTLKSGKKKMAYGFVFTIDGEPISVYFGSKEQTMIYACALLRQKMGEKMYKHEIINNSKGLNPESKHTRAKAKPWIKKVFDFFFDNDNCEFNKWFSGLGRDHGRPLDQGKTQINSKIKANLPESALYFCKVNTKSDDLGDTYYDVLIPAEKITVPKEIL